VLRRSIARKHTWRMARSALTRKMPVLRWMDTEKRKVEGITGKDLEWVGQYTRRAHARIYKQQDSVWEIM
jgi:hypothetical protein